MNQNKTIFRSALAPAFALALVVFVTLPKKSLAVAPRKNAEEALVVAKDCNAFATDIYARLRTEKPTNLFFSPYSISVALAMTYTGAKGETAAEMAQVLHLAAPGSSGPPAPDAVAQSFGTLQKLLNTADKKAGFQLRVANRLWGQQGFHFLPAFLAVTKDQFGAELGQVDFHQAAAARNTINAWVAAQTDDKIQDLLAPGVLNDETRLVLTNAIYFKARWTHTFEKAGTAAAPFHTSAAAEVVVPTMHQREHLRYTAAEDVQILEMPYGADHSLSMLILLPSKIDGLAELESRLTSENVGKWSNDLKLRLVEVALPKFKMTAEIGLGDTLKAMGMPLAFSSKADFSLISTERRLSISAVLHKAFVDVNEEGTEAAAATAVMIKDMALPPTNDIVKFRADHPFVFLIRERRTQTILFLGRLVDPKA